MIFRGYEVADIRNVVEGDPSPCGQGTLLLKRGIERAIFSNSAPNTLEAMNATVLNEGGKSTVMEMGCYGIGVTVWWQLRLNKILTTAVLSGATRWRHSKR